MNKIDEVLELLKQRERESEKPKNVILWVLAIVGAVAAVAGIAYAVYRFVTPDYLEDFEDDFVTISTITSRMKTKISRMEKRNSGAGTWYRSFSVRKSV